MSAPTLQERIQYYEAILSNHGRTHAKRKKAWAHKEDVLKRGRRKARELLDKGPLPRGLIYERKKFNAIADYTGTYDNLIFCDPSQDDVYAAESRLKVLRERQCKLQRLFKNPLLAEKLCAFNQGPNGATFTGAS